MNFTETEFEIVTALETYKAVLPITGEHTVYNIVASCVAVLSAGISLEQSLNYLKDFNGIPGRLEKVESASKKIVFVDYAHTPDALKNVLNSIRKIKKSSHLKNKVICVFGCGGDRDKTKRPIMADVAATLSDFVFITSDNPRTENAMTIINEIKVGLPKDFKNYEIEMDREIAIRNALVMAHDGDVILIAGKGHEDYQIIGTEKKYFSDVAVAQKYLKGN